MFFTKLIATGEVFCEAFHTADGTRVEQCLNTPSNQFQYRCLELGTAIPEHSPAQAVNKQKNLFSKILFHFKISLHQQVSPTPSLRTELLISPTNPRSFACSLFPPSFFDCRRLYINNNQLIN